MGKNKIKNIFRDEVLDFRYTSAIFASTTVGRCIVFYTCMFAIEVLISRGTT